MRFDIKPEKVHGPHINVATNKHGQFGDESSQYTSLINIKTENILEFVMLRKESEPHLGLVITQAAGGRTILL